MSKRNLLHQVEPEAHKAMLALESYLATTSLQSIQRELIKIRASQLNGCSYCIDMHTKDARKKGETEQRLYALSAWHDTPFFTEEEQVMLAITEELTIIKGHLSGATYDKAIRLLGEQLLAQLIMAVVVINAWNRIGVAYGMQPA